MKTFLLTFLVLLTSGSVTAQRLPEWYRVYSFDESVIEMNTSSVILGGDIGRVTFRWLFDQPQQLSGYPDLRYKSRLETIEFNCADKRYRYYEVSLLDSNGQTIHSQLMRSPYAWHEIEFGSVMAAISAQACELIRKRDPAEPKPTADEQIESDKLANFTLSIRQTLEQSGDFRPLIDKFFTVDFIERFVKDDETNWFFNLNRATAAKASRAELKRFYVASLNAGYLTSLYLICQSPAHDDPAQDESVSEEKMLPADVYQLVNNHAYTHTYRSKAGGNDFLAEDIDSIGRMRSYTDLLEKIAALMKEHVSRIHVQNSQQYKDLLETSDLQYRICSEQCLGLPEGTKLFELSMPPLRLQFAKIRGELRIVSAVDSSR
jgi:surface-adhesin protein E